VSIDSQLTGSGVGSALLATAAEVGRREEVDQLWLVTTNDKTGALPFYQRRWLDLVATATRSTSRANRPAKPLRDASSRVPVGLPVISETVGAVKGGDWRSDGQPARRFSRPEQCTCECRNV
jgi:Acetyltransferase (GNAT) family